MHTVIQRVESARALESHAARPVAQRFSAGGSALGMLAERLNQRPSVQAQLQRQRAYDGGPRAAPVQRMSWGGSGVVQREGDSDSEDVVDADPSKYADFDRRAHEEFLRNPIYQQWVQSILEQGSVNVSTGNTDPYAPLAAWRPLARQILIQERVTPSPRRASMMAFEMTNALQTPRTDALKARALAGEFEDPSDVNAGETRYAHEAERSEYDGLSMHHQMMAHGIQNLGWPAALDTYGPKLQEGGVWDTFEKYLAQQEQRGHTNMHRSNYNQWRAP
ncbi:hypothetical protein OWM54_39705 [Myxococcus sp. MISCRS1]|uniref:hypothetical protein n=1 Tax=Myxococcus TaxID=32 RepID=UPI001CBCED2F|nr:MULTISPECIES: hypothetical protein [unclassified Myxococcus]MBZ4398193.1 hypothetical protein [Myxococcus sp. AS-1-15]MBZ4409124.1 hypothetical protein [Myxococcus sp. XM-1-1-1]MCY1003290.1 hypothetical protein [Myxococcus sp. MISCRS1]